MIKRLPRFAETKLENLCAEVGALCQRVTEDESGWDYLIEFPPKQHRGPADTHPPSSSVYVQVKSAARQRLTCRVSLSNALRAAQSRQPWFVILVVGSTKRSNVKIYALHVWEEVISQTLKAVRRAENLGRPLNKVQMTLRFNAPPQNSNLIDWMQAELERVGADYEQKKKHLFETVGYEDGYGTGELSIEGIDGDDLKRNFLGLGQGLKIKRFKFTPSRFGLVSPKPDVDVSKGHLEIEPHSIGPCEVRLRGAGGSETVVLAGDVYSLGIPNLPPEEQTIRFSADPIEVLWTPCGNSKFEMRLAYGQKKPLQTIENWIRLNSWLEAGPIDLQVWFKGKRTVGGELTRDNDEPNRQWGLILGAIKLLRSATGPAVEGAFTASIDDLINANGLRTFCEAMSDGSFRIEFEPLPQTPAKVTSLMYYFSVDVGDCTYYILAERRIKEDVMIGQRRRLTAGKPQFLEKYAFVNATEADRKMFRTDYDRHLARREKTEEPLGLRDLREFIELSKQDKIQQN